MYSIDNKTINSFNSYDIYVESKLPNTYIFGSLSWFVGDGTRQAERDVRLEEPHISLSCCMGEGMRERERARGREHKVLRILRSLCCLILHSSMGQAERNVRLLEPHISLSFLVGDGTQE